MAKGKKSLWESLKDFYRLYTSGLSRSEIETLLKHESVDVFSYYKRDVSAGSPTRKSENFPIKQLRVVRELFISFVMKLTPARRLFYGVAVIAFLLAWLAANWTYAVIAFLLLNALLAFELADKLLTKDELEIAREIQLGLQPGPDCGIAGLEIARYYHPAKEVGGDYYDCIKIDDHRLAVIVGDVSGKGLPAALYAVKLQGLIELLARKGSSPKEILAGINEIISDRIKKNYFITAVLAIFDTKSRKVCLARAGHQPPLYLKAGTKKTTGLEPNGLGIGMENPSEFRRKLQEQTLKIEAGDLLLFYTDGVTEARNGARTEFGEARLAKALTEHANQGAEGIMKELVVSLNGFVKRPLLNDDATMLLVKVKPKP